MSEPRKEVIGSAELWLGDCRDVLSTITHVDALVTDPPYGVDFKGKATKDKKATGGYISGDTDIGPDVVRLALEIADRAVVFPGLRLMYDYPRPYEIGCVYCAADVGLGRWGFTVMHPMLFYGVGLPHTRQGPSGFTSSDSADACDHPCPKPTRWMEWSVNKCTLPGHTVLDPFMGSGTTGMACASLGRKFIGIEIEPKYFDIACRRIETAQRQHGEFARETAATQTGLLW